jgi:hypothetical protein
MTPAADHSLYANVQVPFTEEELDRIEQEPCDWSLEEILAELESKGGTKEGESKNRPDEELPDGGVQG